MHEIILICTVHEEAGACTSGVLLQVLERLHPGIVFEEMPPSAFDEYYTARTRSNLETRTIDRYLKSHRADHIPVDFHDVPPHFFENHRRMHGRVESISVDYRRLIDTHSACVRQYGFAYLNSNYCSDLHRELDRAIEAAVQKMNDEELFRISQSWNAVNEQREQKMIENIYKYSMEHQYQRAVFFVGAGHRYTIIDQIQNYAASKEPRLSWTYDQYEKVLGNA